MFTRDPFDVAPGASRHTRISWLLLIAGLLFAAGCAAVLHSRWQAHQEAQAQWRSVREQRAAQARALATQRTQPADAATQSRLRAQQELAYMLRLSWNSLFDALESAGQQVEGRATVLSLAPARAQADTVDIGITGLAVSEQALLEYLRALQAHPYVRQALLVSQQPAVHAGAPVARFQLTLQWDPRGRPMVGAVTASGLNAPDAAGARR